MKIEKAIEVLKMENELMQFNVLTGDIEHIEFQNQDNKDLYNANLIAIKALEKQTPKEVICDYGLNEIRCPRCNTIVGYAYEEDETEKCTNRRCPLLDNKSRERVIDGKLYRFRELLKLSEAKEAVQNREFVPHKK